MPKSACVHAHMHVWCACLPVCAWYVPGPAHVCTSMYICVQLGVCIYVTLCHVVYVRCCVCLHVCKPVSVCVPLCVCVSMTPGPWSQSLEGTVTCPPAGRAAEALRQTGRVPGNEQSHLDAKPVRGGASHTVLQVCPPPQGAILPILEPGISTPPREPPTTPATSLPTLSSRCILTAPQKD